MDVPKDKRVIKNFVGDGSTDNSLITSLKPAIGQAIFAKEDAAAQLCGFVSLGPAISLQAGITDKAGISLDAGLDLPKITFCAKLAQSTFMSSLLSSATNAVSDVNRGCDAGPFQEAIKLDLEIGAGLSVSGKTSYKNSNNVVTSIPNFEFDTKGKGLYWTWPFPDVCFDISGDNNSNDRTLPPPKAPEKKDPPSNTGIGTGLGSNDTLSSGPLANSTDTGVYDCSGIASSPGGQPCGSVIMQCPSLYTWSCGNGQQGIVPPGTFCAW